ncbi:Arm DNA-binding domain-containing protein [Pseudomonas lundensis]|uniref:Arm DNA-binding domain-containing protein n=1 Tax=Pseudomonas lundensis TaxID=86185 RepID=UPI00352722AC
MPGRSFFLRADISGNRTNLLYSTEAEVVRWRSPTLRCDTPNPRTKHYTLPDYDGLAGAKCWHFRFSWAGKPPRISLGTYPGISLRDARAA